jgi:transposase
MSKAYPSHLTRAQYDFIRDELPAAKPGGCPREVVFYGLVEGIRWRVLPGDCPPWQTVYTSLRNWRKDFT